jgi:NDP-sugar pyrophosphorylase family protein
LDTAGGLAKAASFFDDEDFLLYNVDVVSNIDIQKMLAHHQQNKAIATLAIRQRESSRYLLFDENNHLAGWRNKTTGEEIVVRTKGDFSEYAFSGIHIISPKMLPLLGDIRKHSLTPFYLEIAKENTIAGYEHNTDAWFDCGKPETLAQAANYLNSK